MSPWPILEGRATFVRVASVTDSTHITVTSDDPATTPDPAGIVDSTTQIAWFDPSSYGGNVIKTSTIVNHTGPVGNVTLTLDPAHPFTGDHRPGLDLPQLRARRDIRAGVAESDGRDGTGRVEQ